MRIIPTINIRQNTPKQVVDQIDIKAYFKIKNIDELYQSIIFKQLLAKVDLFNKSVNESQHITIKEIYDNLFVNFSNRHTRFFGKHESGNPHSVLYYKDEQENFIILFKPNFKHPKYFRGEINIKSKHPNLRDGSNKFVKISGLKFIFKPNLEIEVKRVITCSKNKAQEKDKDLRNEYGESFIKEGYKELNFIDNDMKPRIIYVNDYLGESLFYLLSKLSILEIKEIIKNILNNINNLKSLNDIKLDNILYNGNVNFIDTIEPLFTYTTKSDNQDGNFTLVVATQDVKDYEANIEKQRILGLIHVLYQLLNKNVGLIPVLAHDQPKGDFKINDKLSKMVLIKELKMAYEGKLSYDELIKATNNALNNGYPK